MRISIITYFLCLSGFLFGQLDSAAFYFFDDNEVVFQFDTDKLIAEHDQTSLPGFKDIDVFNIPNSYRKWKNKQRWRLKNITNNIFQLRKKIGDFQEPLPWFSKYHLKREYWTQPVSDVSISDTTVFLPQTDVTSYVINNAGKTRFFINGHKFAKEVILAGSFNDWDEHSIKMQKINGGWELRMDLSPGIHEYKFIVDGEWTHDKQNPLKLLNEHSTYNSILLIGTNTAFQLQGYKDARKVFLTGSFNNWEETAIPMRKNDKGWTAELTLPPGKHYYKYIIDGEWIVDPANHLQQNDGDGNMNSVLLVFNR